MAARASPMRTTTLLAALMLTASLAALAPGAQARDLACAGALDPGCDGDVCADTDLNGRYHSSECQPQICTCDPEPDPW